MYIIALTGLARSGKDTAARYIAGKHGFLWLDFSRDALEDELRARRMPLTKENMSVIGDELRKKHGPDALANALVEKIRRSKSEKIVVSGVRSPAEARCLKKNADKFYMIKLVADPKMRIKRSGSTEIIERDERDIRNKGLSEVLEMADVTIENTGTLEDLYRKIDALLA